MPSAVLYCAVLVVNARNWVYLITVAYKISRRLALLAPAPLPARLSGVALTFVGMFLGLWQTVGYAVIDTMFDIVLYKAICCVLKQSGLAALVVWWLWKSFLGELRIGARAWQLLKLVFKEARMLVLAPQALLLQQAALVSCKHTTCRGGLQLHSCVLALYVSAPAQLMLGKVTAVPASLDSG